jgi:hypothetical protein
MDELWPVIGQFSSIGSLGPASHSWLCSEWLLSLSSVVKKTGLASMHKYPNLQLVSYNIIEFDLYMYLINLLVWINWLCVYVLYAGFPNN